VKRQTDVPVAQIEVLDEGEGTPSTLVMLVTGSVFITLILILVAATILLLQLRQPGRVSASTDPEAASMIVLPENHDHVQPSSDHFTPSPVGKLPHAEYTH